MQKIIFVNPSIKHTVFGKMRQLALPPMGLGLLASRTPADGYEIEIVDEAVDTIDFSAEADLVAVTATTVQAPRAYEILRRFRRRGITTIIGGIHASVMTEEASRHADSVAVGEADDLWGGILDDFAQGALQPLYRMREYPRMDRQPRIDRSVFGGKYFIPSVQTSRGCPCNCSFCSVTLFNGKRYRFRSVRDVIEELEQLPDRRLFISDDSIVGLGSEGVDHARSLFGAMKGLGKSWGSQVCITIAEHDDVLRAAADAGANTFYIGFESVDAAALKTMDKRINLRPSIRNTKETIARFHDHGIGVIGGFILGTDADTRDVFERTCEFIHETEIDGCQFTVMTPFPGTRFYRQMERENRLLYTDFPSDWHRYNAYEVVIEPKNMTVEELERGQRWAYEATATMGKSFARGVRTLWNTHSVENAFTNFFWNYLNYRAMNDIAV